MADADAVEGVDGRTVFHDFSAGTVLIVDSRAMLRFCAKLYGGPVLKS